MGSCARTRTALESSVMVTSNGMTSVHCCKKDGRWVRSFITPSYRKQKRGKQDNKQKDTKRKNGRRHKIKKAGNENAISICKTERMALKDNELL
jgi:hypothetical protein